MKSKERKQKRKTGAQGGLGKREGRYARQLIVKSWNQQKLRESRVLLAGIGALGSVVATNLVSLGIGEITIIDFDTIEISNLNRQIIFREKDVGKYKVDVASRYLSDLNPDVKVRVINDDIHSVPQSVYEASNVVIDALDTFEDRRWLNSVCVTLKKPLVHGGTYEWMGNVQVVVPYKSPCLECQPLIPAERLQKACTPPGERRIEEENMHEDKKDEKEEKIPSIPTVSTIIGGVQAQEALKLIMEGENTSILDNYLFYDGRSENFTVIELQRNPECFVCGDKFLVKTIEYAIDKEESIRSLKDRLISSWGLVEPIRVILKGQILEDSVKTGQLQIEADDSIYIYDKSLFKPIRLALKPR